MTGSWYILRTGKVSGPFSPEQVIRASRDGTLADSDFLALEQGGEWSPLGQVKSHLLELARATPISKLAAPGEGDAKRALTDRSDLRPRRKRSLRLALMGGGAAGLLVLGGLGGAAVMKARHRADNASPQRRVSVETVAVKVTLRSLNEHTDDLLPVPNSSVYLIRAGETQASDRLFSEYQARLSGKLNVAAAAVTRLAAYRKALSDLEAAI